ncbi:MAG: DUF4426 domain-containing protein [Gammaproteobacteria bacterium]|nr:DUF4426 domain-containing protein [Gammaproteobacteria bacterium]
MTISRILMFASALALASACGGPDESADIPDAQPAVASFEDIGDHVVHFSAQTTDELPREVAQAYQIQRSPDRAMLNVSVIRKSDSASVKATVSVKTRNLTQQLKNIDMREVNEQGAIYYIGETKVANRETLIFELAVKPDGVGRSANIRFQKQFYTD